MVAEFLPDCRLASAQPRSCTLYAMHMDQSEWDVYSGVLYPFGCLLPRNFPLPFRPGDLLYDPYSVEGTLGGGIRVVAKADSYGRCLAFQEVSNKISCCNIQSSFMSYEYYPTEALTERHRLLSLLSEFLKGKQCSWNFCWDFTTFLAGYHDLLLPPFSSSAVVEETDGNEIKIPS